ncbi:hypothetical protein M4951_00570 [Blastopirellula sp. J2-11]|uniref:hypothetical protein n=1 Tax=Blastopirellula sp. J2-11 TaxID=2943192 RepID=UPI0021CA8EE8|nr:hypothetical protein [Blastopirellula sp. J2-11]UUO06821.1 hypothetical protein M4951_00570 [Blastopirellula sp. J2-11]
MRLSLLSLAMLPFAFAPLGCGQPAGQVSDQSDEYSSYIESTGNEETKTSAAENAPKLEQHEVHRESLDDETKTDEMTVKNESPEKATEQSAAAAEERGGETSPVSTDAPEAKAEESQPAKSANDKKSQPAESAKEEAPAKEEAATPQPSEHVDPPQSELEVSLQEVEEKLNTAKTTLQKYSNQQEKKDFRNSSQKQLDDNQTNRKPLKEEISHLQAELQQKQQRLEKINSLTEEIQAKIDQLDPTSAEPDEKLRQEIEESLSQLQRLQSDSDRQVAQQK